jgi:hypothetical protein
MAEVMSLVQYSLIDGTDDSIDLLGGTLKLEEKSWSTLTATPQIAYDYLPFAAQAAFENYDVVTETFNLIGSGTVSALTTAIVDLEEAFEDTRLAHAGEVGAEPWWLVWHADGEESKRALLYGGAMKFPTSTGVNPLLEYQLVKVQVTLIRAPLWESIDGATSWESFTDGGSGVSTTGGQIEFSDIKGSAPARIRGISANYDTRVSGTLSEWWIGVRATHAGTGNFESLWECEDGTNGTDASDQADAAASGGNAVRVTFGTTSLAKRMTITVNDACSHSDYDHQFGRYLVLCRCKVASGTAGIQMRTGYSEQNVYQEIYIDNTSYMFHPLGEITIPPWTGYRYASSLFVKEFAITLYAEKLSTGGSDYLWLDALVLMPAEHLLYIDGTTIDDTSKVLEVITNDDETSSSFVLTSAASETIEDGPALAPRDWQLPVAGGVLVVVAQGTSSHILSEDLTFTLAYYPRWLAYRNDSATT